MKTRCGRMNVFTLHSFIIKVSEFTCEVGYIEHLLFWRQIDSRISKLLISDPYDVKRKTRKKSDFKEKSCASGEAETSFHFIFTCPVRRRGVDSFKQEAFVSLFVGAVFTVCYL